MAATHDDHLDAIVFDIDGHKLLKIAWVYDENDDLDTVCEEVWGEIKKATRAASEDDLQIITAKGAIRLRRCLQKALQGNATVVSTVDDRQLMLKVEVLGKVAGNGRATGASRARSTGRSMARHASSSSAAAMSTAAAAAAAAAAAPGAAETPAAEDKSSKLLSRVFVMWPKHTQTVLAFMTTSDGNPDLDDMGNPKVDHKNSCYKGQCIKVSEKDLVWEPLRLAIVQVMEDVFGVSTQDAAEKIRKKASQQAKTIEHAHAAADAAKTAAIAEMLRAAEHGSMGAEAADEISEAVEAAVAAAVPATAFKTTSDGNPDLDDMGNPKVDHKNSCYKGQCIKVSEKDLVWEPLRLAIVQVMEDVFGVSTQDAAEKIRK
uniref:Uncharacterized protein n=1 Tax=Tetradesmus obliquus TaxID=3088 RepID=A0A383VC61_TETOB|eukprot:jgi/Sobl393_1/852/SZX62523.1